MRQYTTAYIEIPKSKEKPRPVYFATYAPEAGSKWAIYR